MRYSQPLLAKWEDVDRENDCFTVRSPKTAKQAKPTRQASVYATTSLYLVNHLERGHNDPGSIISIALFELLLGRG